MRIDFLLTRGAGAARSRQHRRPVELAVDAATHRTCTNPAPGFSTPLPFAAASNAACTVPMRDCHESCSTAQRALHADARYRDGDARIDMAVR